MANYRAPIEVYKTILNKWAGENRDEKTNNDYKYTNLLPCIRKH